NALYGNQADNYLDGGAGADVMSGGAGDDVYVVDNATDQVIELADGQVEPSFGSLSADNVPSEAYFNRYGHVGFAGTRWGSDVVKASVSYGLAANIETLILTGAAAIDGTGNELGNTLVGNAAANLLDGGAGEDVMRGGRGNDTYRVDNAGDVVVENAAEGVDSIRASVSYTLSANVENLTLTGNAIAATGNEWDNTVIGNAQANLLDGAAGADVMIGGQGDDTYAVDQAGDVVVEADGEGDDTVVSAIDYTLGANLENLTLAGSAVNATGNHQSNVLIGNAQANLLDGAAAADQMAGADGDDTYVVDDAGDRVVEMADEGADTVLASVSYSLSDNVENLTLTGTADLAATGNALSNILSGNSGNNLLDGSAGADSLMGGAGDDTYVVDNAGDVLVERADEGTDAVLASVSYGLSAHVERLTLTGTADISATGNELDNTLLGNAGANTLDGAAGADAMAGGVGNDTYIVDNASDRVLELAGEGVDTVLSSVSYSLSANVENLSLTGAAGTNA
ncbi:MAG: calcium-binding protein, partial [Longimicrobiales bacterium]